MKRDSNEPMRAPAEQQQPAYESFPDVTPRRIGGDDSLENSSPTDIRSDEKVIVNEQHGSKTFDTPYQAVVNTKVTQGNDDDIVDDQNSKGSL